MNAQLVGAATRALTLGLAVVGLAVLGLAAVSPAADAGPLQDRGRAIAEAKCARCHAVRARGDSPVKPAPPFRTLPQRYPVENLAEALAEGIFVGHAMMPEFRFDPPEIDALLAYIESLSPPRRR
jgi:mono/diheme cytochrome c family protein